MNFESKLAQSFFDKNIEYVEEKLEKFMDQVDALYEDIDPSDQRALYLVVVQERIKNFREISIAACQLELEEKKINVEAATLLTSDAIS